MSDARRLEDKLAKLGARTETPSAGERSITASQKADFIRAVLLEIDETILGRYLVFQNENKQGFTIEVANRRLHRVSEITFDSPGNSFTDFIGQQFSEQDSKQTSRFSDILDAFFDVSQKYFVRSERLERTLDPADIGCAAMVMAKAFSVDLYEDNFDEADNFSEQIHTAFTKLATSWVRIDATGKTKSAGNLAQLQRLKLLINHDFAKFDQQLNGSFGTSSRFVVLGPDVSKGHSILYLKAGNQGTFLIVKSTDLSELQSIWRAQLS